VQLAGEVQIRTPTGSTSLVLPVNSVVTDFAEGRLLYTLNGGVHAFRVANGKDTLLLKGSARTPVFATLDTHGLGWAQGTSVNFACGGCVSYTP